MLWLVFLGSLWGGSTCAELWALVNPRRESGRSRSAQATPGQTVKISLEPQFQTKLQLAPVFLHQAIIKAGLISKTQDLECQKLLTTFLFLMFYPIKRLLPVKLCERKVLMPSKWIEVAVMLIKYQQRAAVLIQASSSQLKHPEKDECCLLCCRDDRWDAEECAYLIKKIIYVNTPCTCQLPQDK